MAERGKYGGFPDMWVMNPDHSVEPVETLEEWAKRFDPDTRQVGSTKLTDGRWLSTVFLGINHQFHGAGPPLLFETAILAEDGAEVVERYASFDDAEIGHRGHLKRLQAVKVG